MDIIRKLLLTKNEVFIIANAEAGSKGSLIVEQDSVGNHDLTLPNNNDYRGFITLSKSAGAITLINWIATDSYIYVYTEGSGFNIVPVAGTNGQTLYTWIRYADTPTSGMSANPLNKTYIGIAYNKTTATPSINYSDYTWALIKGNSGLPGNDGLSGRDGIDGRDGINGLDGDTGSPGRDGEDGLTTYFHVQYSNSPNGNPMSQSAGLYIGTYVDYTAQDSNDYTRYTWKLLKGADGVNGTDGIAGVNGSNGQTSYLHIKYSNNAGVSFTGNSGEDVGTYIGQYTDFTLADSNNPALYKWALIKGSDGANGAKGDKGDKGEIGNEGIQGRQGAYITYHGDYNGGKTYIMYQDRIVAVRYNNVYFSTKVSTGNIPVGTVPTNTNYWNPLNSYANIATDILLAQDAYLAKLESKNIYLGDGTSGWVITQGSIKSIQTNPNGTARTSLTSDGRLFATNVNLTGNINATSGSIGGILIGANGIESTNFSINSQGIAQFTNASISGTINSASGNIGGWAIDNANITSPNEDMVPLADWRQLQLQSQTKSIVSSRNLAGAKWDSTYQMWIDDGNYTRVNSVINPDGMVVKGIGNQAGVAGVSATLHVEAVAGASHGIYSSAPSTSWALWSNGNSRLEGAQHVGVRSVATMPYKISASDYFLIVNASGVIYLPAIDNGIDGRTIKIRNTTGNNVTVSGDGRTILTLSSGIATTFQLGANQACEVISTGTVWVQAG